MEASWGRVPPSTWPKPDWNDADYAAAATTLIKRWRQKLSDLAQWGVKLDGLRVSAIPQI